MRKSQDMRNEKHEKTPRNSVLAADTNETQKNKAANSSRASHNRGKNSKWKTVDATQYFVDQLKPNSYRVSKDNNNEEKTAKENYAENNKLKTLPNKTQDLSNSREPSNASEATKNLDSALPDQSKHDSPNHTTTFTEEICADDDDAALEEKRRLRRERVKIKKEMKKQEKAILREEEMRKKRLAPKDQKITIIDHNTLNRFLEKETSSHNSEARIATYDRSEFPALGKIRSPTEFPALGETRSTSEFPALEKVRSTSEFPALGKIRSTSEFPALGEIRSTSEFPALGEIRSPRNSPNRFPKKHGIKRGKSSLVSTSTEKSVPQESSGKVDSRSTPSEKRDQSTDTRSSSSGAANVALRNKPQENPESDDVKFTDESRKTTKLEDKSVGKRPKRRDPIQLDITEILKVQEAKQEVSVKQHTKPTSKAEVVRYAGNILDSDNPERKRGKQREVPKAKKPSTLKQIILQERTKRKEARIQKTNESNTKEANSSKKQHSGSDVAASEGIMSTSAKIESKSVDNTDVELKVQSVDLNTNSSDCKETKIAEFHLDIVPFNLQSSEDEQKIDSEIERSQHISEVNEVNEVNEVKHNSIINGKDESVSLSLFTREEIEAVITRKKPVKEVTAPKIHSRKFRDYCDHFVTPEILNAATTLLEDIVKFHDRQYARSPLKASAKRRHVTGLKEVRRFMALRRVRLLVIAPDLEHTPSAGGLDDIVTQLKESAVTNEVPYVFALNRRHLGYILKKKVPVSCVGVLNYDGTEHNFRNLMSAVEQAREAYQLKVAGVSPPPTPDLPPAPTPDTDNKQIEEVPSVEEDVNKEVVASLLAKLSAPRKVDCPSPFLQAIERCTSLDSDSDEDVPYEDDIF